MDGRSDVEAACVGITVGDTIPTLLAITNTTRAESTYRYNGTLVIIHMAD